MIPILIHHVSDIWEFEHKVTFDGPHKLILINDGITEINFKVDVYSNWKEWVLMRENSAYEQAFTAVGGDTTTTGKLGTTYFLENNWQIRTWEGDHKLTVDGNIYTRAGTPIFTPVLGNFNIETTLNISNLVDVVETGVLAGIDSVNQIDEIHKLHGLDIENDLVVTATSRDAGPDVSQTITDDSGTVTISRD